MDADLVTALRREGVDVLTTLEAERTGRSDEEQLLYATEQRRVIYSYNIKDLVVLNTAFLTEGHSHGGIIVAHQARYGIGEEVRRLVALMEAISAENMKDRLEYLTGWG
jgi:hypothetical protein